MADSGLMGCYGGGLVLCSRGEHGQEQDWISCRILAIFLDQDWIWTFIFLKKLDQDISLISMTKFS